MRTHWTLAALFLALLATSGCHKPSNASKRGSLVERLPRAEVVRPRRQELIRTVELSATAEALKKVDLSARVPGVVTELADTMDIGRKVREGEVLLRLGAPELTADLAHKRAVVEQAKRQLKQSSNALTVAKREVDEVEKEDKRFKAEALFAMQRLERIKELVRQRAQDAVVEQEAQRQYEAAEAAREANQARKAKREAMVAAAEADLELAAQRIVVADADLKKAEELVGFTTIRAPFDGVVTRRWVDPGAIIRDPGTVLLTVMQMSRIRVLVDIPQRDVPLINSREENPNPGGDGDPAVIIFPMLSEVVPGGRFLGSITRVGRSLDPVTRTMRAEIVLDNSQGYIRPGMFGTALVTVEDRKQVLTVPASALVRKEGMVGVYIVANPEGEGEERRGVLKLVELVLGIDDGKQVEVRSGLRGDELVVARGASVMRADEEVLAIDAP
jgi:RND family efflux transporter MFP subunit